MSISVKEKRDMKFMFAKIRTNASASEEIYIWIYYIYLYINVMCIYSLFELNIIIFFQMYFYAHIQVQYSCSGF